jgi:hypothetical protein
VAYDGASLDDVVEDPAAMPWPARVATFVLAFDGQMGNGRSQFWITNGWRVDDPALLAVLEELRSPLVTEAPTLTRRIAKIGVLSDGLDAQEESPKVDAAYQRLA